MARDVTARELQTEVLSRLRSQLSQTMAHVSSTSPVYQLIVVHHDAQEEKIDQSADMPLLTPAFTLSMKNCPTGTNFEKKLFLKNKFGRNKFYF